MKNQKRIFLASIIADLGKILVGGGALKEIFSEKHNWLEIILVSLIAIVLFIIAYKVYPDNKEVE